MMLANPQLVVSELVHVLRQVQVAFERQRRIFVERMEGRHKCAETELRFCHARSPCGNFSCEILIQSRTDAARFATAPARPGIMETSVLTERRLRLKSLRFFLAVAIAIGSFLSLAAGCSRTPAPNASVVPEDIKAVFDLPLYEKALWGLRVVDVSSGNVLIDSQPGHNFLVGSVRKIFSIGELLNQIGPDHTFDTPVYRLGDLDRAGVLHGNLILV